jgi:hypothetical protein
MKLLNQTAFIFAVASKGSFCIQLQVHLEGCVVWLGCQPKGCVVAEETSHCAHGREIPMTVCLCALTEGGVAP